jgi:ubiquinone/menaquinone biosynthesis C-methylase UbiE
MDPMHAYYDRRASEFDDWYLGTGIFAARDRPGWDEELAVLIRTIEALRPARTLDLGCGTGFLTEHLPAPRLVALDQSGAMLRRARERVPRARFVRGDGLALPFPDASFERVFTGHVYGHIRSEDRERFLAEARAVGSELVVVDAGRRGGPPRDEWQDRQLKDGSRHRVFKRFFTAQSLLAELGDGRALHEGPWFVAVVSPGGKPISRRSVPQDGAGD